MCVLLNACVHVLVNVHACVCLCVCLYVVVYPRMLLHTIIIMYVCVQCVKPVLYINPFDSQLNKHLYIYIDPCTSWLASIPQVVLHVSCVSKPFDIRRILGSGQN